MKQLIESMGVSNVIIYLIIINIVGFFAMGIDKWKAKKKCMENS